LAEKKREAGPQWAPAPAIQTGRKRKSPSLTLTTSEDEAEFPYQESGTSSSQPPSQAELEERRINTVALCHRVHPCFTFTSYLRNMPRLLTCWSFILLFLKQKTL
jgi:hypothetical protein